jgi:hypothetical protein
MSAAAPFFAVGSDLRASLGAEGELLVASRPIEAVKGTLRAGDTDGDGVHVRLPAEVIQRGVRARYSKVRACYERVLARDPNATGLTTTRFVIDRQGKVSSAQTTITGNLPPEMKACVEAMFLSLEFDPPDGGIVTVTYPIKLSPGGTEP